MREELLFSADEVSSLSPRLRWMYAHNVKTHSYSSAEIGSVCPETGVEIRPWAAWIERISGEIQTLQNSSFGETEDEAIASVAIKNGIRLWNEEE